MIDFNTQELRETYYSEISALADDYEKRILAGEFEDRDAFFTDVHETLDGHEFVTTRFKAQCACLVSDNNGAMVDNFGSEGLTKDGRINWEGIAYCAMEQDLYDALDSAGVDINDDDTFEGEEEEEDAEDGNS